jgi:hypothetical protein
MFRSRSLPRIVGSVGLVVALVSGAAGVDAISASAAPTGPTFLAASNTGPAFDFMTQDFVQTANGGNSVTFSFGGSGHLAGELDGGVDFASDGSGNSPAGFALFASADEANVDNTIPSGSPAAENSMAVEKNSVGQCIDAHSAGYSAANGGNNNGTSCPGIGSTRAQYTTGRLVIFSCRSGGTTLAPAQGAPTCAEPVAGFFTKSGTKAPRPPWPRCGAISSRTPTRPTGEPPVRTPVGTSPSPIPRTVGSSRTRAAALPRSRRTPRTGSRDGGALRRRGAVLPRPPASRLRCDRFRPGLQGDRQDDRPRLQPGQLQHHQRVVGRTGGERQLLRPHAADHLRRQRDLHPGPVVAGTSEIALLPKSFVFSPAGNDTDFWAEVPECGVANAADAPCRTAGRPASPTPSRAPTATTSPECTTTSRRRSARATSESRRRAESQDVGGPARVLPADPAVGGRRKRRPGSGRDRRPGERRRRLGTGVHPLFAFGQRDRPC